MASKIQHAASPSIDTLLGQPNFRRTQPADQADGLRRLFSQRSLRFIPVVSNPFIAHGGVLIERLCSALELMELDTLLVDASERGGPPEELSSFDLAEGIEPLSSRVHYLAARGLPVRWVDSRGSTRGFLDAVVDAAPQSQVVLVHASAIEISRLFGRGDEGLSRPRPIVLCDDQPDAMTHAYAAMKVFAQRADWLSHDLLLCAPPGSTRAKAVADRLAHCADMFLGGVQHSCVRVDPAEPPTAAPSRALMGLVEASLTAAAVLGASEPEYAGLRSALPAPRLSMS
ncbi:flagellar biosynthesis protein [Leptothrix discophora]|uniref:Flagellar biosynthesis protein n=1 Tax=Leptothrix discophora TaxID=89 RepID=A0ABT9G508_LEPDI|nr:flagellar biosynthesis protein [Leptothrix discophora]MDP4301568.1 flagellar biosynthesis protein [Leptothrix discophora]